ncbi:MAG: hypothetical protein U1E37_04965 [Sphingomonadaceae bacterium]
MARETRCRPGAVPRQFGEFPLGEEQRIFFEGQFAMRTGSGHAFHYQPGAGVTVESSSEADPAESALWLSGSVYAAVAVLNGFYPVHASAVAHNGQVHAFTGPSGAGKSTLVAGLGQRGLPLFCDDTMLLDLSDPARIIALPGHKRLKLTNEALALTGAAEQEPVGSDTGKSYALSRAGTAVQPLPLARLAFLEAGATCAVEPITGGERLLRLDDDHYTLAYYLEARQPRREELFKLRTRLAQQLDMARLIRPMDRGRFAESLDLAERLVRGNGQGVTG